MALESVDQATVIQFSALIDHEVQQSKARLRPFVIIKEMKGKAIAYDGLGDVEAREVVGRHQPASFDDIFHNRRKISRRRYVVNLPIDESDVRAIILNPDGEYAKACAMAMERRFDRTVVEVLFATVKTGEDFETDVTFANDGGRTVDATAGWTYEKLLEIGKNFVDDEVGNDMPVNIILGMTGEEEEALMKESELISGDFTRQFAVEKGQLTFATGKMVIKFGGAVQNPILAVSGGTRDNFAMAERGVCVGLSQDIKIKVEERTDLIETRQVQIIGEWGAVRTQGQRVQKVQTTDA